MRESVLAALSAAILAVGAHLAFDSLRRGAEQAWSLSGNLRPQGPV